MQFFSQIFLKPLSQTTDATDSHQHKHKTKQAKTRAGGQIVEEDDKVEAEEEAEEEKHYVPYYL